MDKEIPPVWIHPSTGVVAAPTFSGKTVFVRSLIESNVITPSPELVIWFYNVEQPLNEEMQESAPCKLVFHKGLPDGNILEFLDSFGDVRKFVVLDDMMHAVVSDARVTQLFTQGSHHRNLSVLYITQNIFSQGKEARTIALNSHYLILFKNPRDKQQILHLGRQMYPGKRQVLLESYEDATKRPFGYLMICLRADVDEQYRLSTNVLPQEEPRVYYIPKFLT